MTNVAGTVIFTLLCMFVTIGLTRACMERPPRLLLLLVPEGKRKLIFSCVGKSAPPHWSKTGDKFGLEMSQKLYILKCIKMEIDVVGFRWCTAR